MVYLISRPLQLRRIAAIATLVSLATAVVPGAAFADASGSHPTEPLSFARAQALSLTADSCQPSGPSSQDVQLASTLGAKLDNDARLGGQVNAYQVSCARAIVDAVRAKSLDERAAVIALSTAITETSLHNWDGGDDDSVGLFQQRPSQGWGDPAELESPAYATGAFLSSMQQHYPNNAWMSGDIGVIIQTVQKSAYPDRYDPEVHNAQVIADALWSDSTKNPATIGDYNGDGLTDRVVYRPSTGQYWVQYYGSNGSGVFTTPVPAAGDVPVPGDYNADGLFDFATFNSGTGQWKVHYHGSDGVAINTWGSSGDIPAPGDYDGDGFYDRAVYRPSTGHWLLQAHSGGTGDFAPLKYAADDIPVAGDYNNDGKADFAVFSPSSGEWKIRYHTSGMKESAIFTWGQAGDIPVPGDYDGDGFNDRAVYRPSTGQFWIQYHSGGTAIFDSLNHAATDVPVVGDFNGDGKADFAVFNPSSGEWKIRYHTSDMKESAIYTWGQAGDIPATR